MEYPTADQYRSSAAGGQLPERLEIRAGAA
jgi:hypothetical protein